MPAEWMPHHATWLSWPHNLETWPTQLERVREVWV
ncbi:MAG TPA: agmatine deiminase family protein, partial [Candidatus Binatia bacterium]|nr:agmatine deiminase family protein [Candidatus Binatia bacterium]